MAYRAFARGFDIGAGGLTRISYNTHPACAVRWDDAEDADPFSSDHNSVHQSSEAIFL